MRLLLFALDANRYGVPADAVVEIVRAVAVTPVPGTPDVVEGIINVRGALVPVFDLRLRFSGRPSVAELSHQFVLVNAGPRVAALHVDRVLDLAEVDDRAVADPRQPLPTARYVDGAVSLDDGLVLIHNVETFLSRAEAETLDDALAAAAAGAAVRP